MERIGMRTSISRCTLFAAVLVVVIANGSLGMAQGSNDWAIDQAQRAVRERIADQEHNVTVRFTSDARTESSSNTNLRVRGTGTVTRDDRKTRLFSYDAVVNRRNSRVSDVHHDWRGDWLNAETNRLTGAYRLNRGRSDDAGATADRATRTLPRGEQQRLRNAIMRRLEAPESLAIERDGRSVTLASSASRPVTFEADGRELSERSGRGRSMRTTAVLSGDRLVVTTDGDRSVDYQVTFEPMDNGRRLRVTRRVTDEDLRDAVVANSVYDKTSDAPRFDAFRSDRDSERSVVATTGRFIVPGGTELVATLNDHLSTQQARDGDRFTLSVRSPSQYADATIEAYVVRTSRSGQVSGRAELAFEFDSIRQRDGRTYDFAGSIESVRTANGDEVRVDNEGRVQDADNQTERTVERTGIGAGIGAVIGAVAGGGKGAAIGAAIGGGAGAGSVFIQGRDDLELGNGTEFRIRARSRD
jgi:YMGG-like Gly-zipper